MNLVKLKDVVESIEKLRGAYGDLEGLIVDQVRDGQINDAANNIKKLQGYRDAIEQMENLNVQIESPAVNRRV